MLEASHDSNFCTGMSTDHNHNSSWSFPGISDTRTYEDVPFAGKEDTKENGFWIWCGGFFKWLTSKKEEITII